jgi:hypothetical protein
MEDKEFLVGKPETKKLLEGEIARYEDNIKMNFKEFECSVVGWIQLIRYMI